MDWDLLAEFAAAGDVALSGALEDDSYALSGFTERLRRYSCLGICEISFLSDRDLRVQQVNMERWQASSPLGERYSAPANILPLMLHNLQHDFFRRTVDYFADRLCCPFH